MQFIHRGILIPVVIITLMLAGCGLYVPSAVPTPGPGAYAATIAALQTKAVGTATAQGFGAALTQEAPSFASVQTNGSLRSPVVASDATCLWGPGPEFGVIATVAHGTEVQLLGRGVISGWFIIREPASGTPCWLQGSIMQFPADYNFSALPLLNPPATATVTPLPTSATPGVSGTATP